MKALTEPTPSDQLLPLIDQVGRHFAVAHELLEAQKIQAAGPQTEERVRHNPETQRLLNLSVLLSRAEETSTEQCSFTIKDR